MSNTTTATPKPKKGKKKKSDKLSKKRLPKHIIPIPCSDKIGWHEKWTPRRDLLNIPHPFRGVLLGPPNSGKSTLVKNLLIRARPQFKEIFVVHCDPDFTTEYDDVGAEMLSEIPAPDEWEGEKKTLVILDDLEYKSMDKHQTRNLNRLLGFVSTHKNISVLLCQQDPFEVPPIVRRCSNLWCLWRMSDIDSVANVSRKAGLKSKDLASLFNLCKGVHDSIWIDMTTNTPAKLRLNGYQIINKQE